MRPRKVEVSFYRAFIVSKVGRRWHWRHESCDGDNRHGVAKSRDAAIAAVDAWYERPRGMQIVNGMSPREVLTIFGILIAGFVAIYIALAVRTGGF